MKGYTLKMISFNCFVFMSVNLPRTKNKGYFGFSLNTVWSKSQHGCVRWALREHPTPPCESERLTPEHHVFFSEIFELIN